MAFATISPAPILGPRPKRHSIVYLCRLKASVPGKLMTLGGRGPPMEGTRRLPAAPSRLLAASTRPRTVATLAGCAILVAVLGVLFAHQTTADGFDRAVDAPLVTVFSGHSALA